MRVTKFIAIRLPILIVGAVCVPIALSIPEYRQLAFMGAIGVAIFVLVDQVLPRVSIEDLTRFQTNLVIWVGAALALPSLCPSSAPGLDSQSPSAMPSWE